MNNVSERIKFFKSKIENDSKFQYLPEIQDLQKNNNLTELESIELDILLIRYNIDMAKYEYSLQKSLELKKKCEKISYLPYMLVSIAYILESLNPLGREIESAELLDTGNEILSKISDALEFDTQKIIGHYLFISGLIFQRMEKYEDSLDLYRRSLEVRKNIDDKLGVGKSLLHIGQINMLKSRNEIALTSLEESLKNSLQFESNMCSTWAYLHIAFINIHLGKLDEVLEFTEKGYTISKLFNNSHTLSYYSEIMGHYYREMGEYSKSLDFFNKSLAIKKKNNITVEIGDSYYNIGTIYSNRGDLNLAVKYYQKLLELAKKEGNIVRYVHVLSLYGKLLGEKGEFEDAIKFLTKSLTLSYENNLFINSARIIYYLICVCLNKKDIKKANFYLQESKKLVHSHNENKNIIQIHKLNEAIILKKGKRYRDKFFSQKLLKDIADDEIFQIEISIDAMLNLLESYLFELTITNDKKIIGEIHELNSKLMEIGKNQKSSSLIAETTFFKAKIKLIEGNLIQSRKLLIEAQNYAEENGLGRLANEISNEHDSLLSQMKNWDDNEEFNVPFNERIKYMKYDFLFSKAVRNLNKDLIYEKEDPFFILIWSTRGISIFEYQFRESDPKISVNIAGFLYAIDIVGKEALLSKGSIDRIKFDEKTVLIKKRDQFHFAYAFEGHSYYALKHIESFIQKITEYSEIWDRLKKCETIGEKINEDLHNSIISIVNQIF